MTSTTRVEPYHLAAVDPSSIVPVALETLRRLVETRQFRVSKRGPQAQLLALACPLDRPQ